MTTTWTGLIERTRARTAALAALLTFLVIAAAPHTAAAALFDVPVVTATGDNPRSMVGGDFDRDGDPDLQLSYQGDDTIGLVSNAGGLFTHEPHPTTTGIGNGPNGIASADFDRDGDVDFATVNKISRDLWVFSADGAGGTTRVATLGYETPPAGNVAYGSDEIATADMNGDGWADIVVNNRVLPSHNGVSVFLNDRTSGFAFTPTRYELYGSPDDLDALALADVDRDGDTDGVVGSSTAESVTVMENDGAGALTPGGVFSVPGGPIWITPADFDRDGHLDLAVGTEQFGTSVLTSDGAGGFTGTRVAGNLVNQLAASDLDHDGDLDLVASEGGASGPLIRQMINVGGAFPQDEATTVRQYPATIVPADYDGDGDDDLALSHGARQSFSPTPASVSYLANTTPRPAAAVRFTATAHPAGAGATAIVSGDFDRDGTLDVATANETDGDVTILGGSGGSGGFAAPVSVPVAAPPRALVSGDFDADGDLDLASAGDGGPSVSLLLNDGDGAFTASTTAAAAARSIVAGDFDRDGDLDLATAASADGSVSLLSNGGSGGFAVGAGPAGTGPAFISSGDFDRDGDLDLARVGIVNGAVTVLVNNGAGTFTPGLPSAPTLTALAVSPAADLNRDGWLDLVLTNTVQDSVTVLSGQPGGGFAPTTVAAGTQPRSAAIGDADGDGDLDVVTANATSDEVRLLRNDGSGALTTQTAATVAGNGPDAVVVADADGDGLADVLAADDVSGDVSLLRSVTSPPTLMASASPLAYAEGDGARFIDPDLAVGDPDDAVLASATAQMVSGYDILDDDFTFTPIAGNPITAIVQGGGQLIRLQGPATRAQFEEALRAVTFSNGSDRPSTTPRVVRFGVTDPAGANATATRTIEVSGVNDVPTVTTSPGATAWTEDGPAYIVDANVEITDLDGFDTLSEATIQITGGYEAGTDELVFYAVPGIVSSWDATSGTMTLTDPTRTLLLQESLRRVGFRSNTNSPSTATRTISYRVTDGVAQSAAATKDVTVTAVDDQPTLGGVSAGALAVTENDDAAAIAPAVTVADPDSGALQSATVRFTAGYSEGEDVLALDPPAGNPVTAAFDATDGTLTLTGPATPAEFEAALRAVTYRDTSDAPSTAARTVSLRVADATSQSAAATRAIAVTAVNDAPLLTLAAAPLEIVAAGPPVALDADMGLDDADSQIAAATVTVSDDYAAGEDQLTFTAGGGVTGSFDALGGTLSLQGPASAAAMQAALRSVTFRTTSLTPASGTRTLTVSVSDSSGDAATGARTVAIERLPVSDAAPTVGGGRRAGQTLTATAGDWRSATTLAYGYRWQRCDAAGSGCSDLAGATGQTHAISDADVGATLRAVVTATNEDGAVEAFSTATAPIRAPLTAPLILSGPAAQTASRSVSVAFSGEQDAQFACALDAAAFAACTSPVAFSGLDLGRHRIEVRQADAAGETSAAATVTWTITDEPPPPDGGGGPAPGGGGETPGGGGETPGGGGQTPGAGGGLTPGAGGRSPAGRSGHTPGARTSHVSLVAARSVKLRAGGVVVAGCRLDRGLLRSCTVTAKAGRRTLGRGTTKLRRAGGRTDVRIRLTGAARRAVARARRGVPIRLTATAVTTAGARLTTTKAVRIVR